jgi:hypothetical protein
LLLGFGTVLWLIFSFLYWFDSFGRTQIRDQFPNTLWFLLDIIFILPIVVFILGLGYLVGRGL